MPLRDPHVPARAGAALRDSVCVQPAPGVARRGDQAGPVDGRLSDVRRPSLLRTHGLDNGVDVAGMMGLSLMVVMLVFGGGCVAACVSMMPRRALRVFCTVLVLVVQLRVSR